MDYIMIYSIILVFGGIGVGIGYAIGFRRGVEAERQRRAEKEEMARQSLVESADLRSAQGF